MKYNRIDNTAPIQSALKANTPDVKRSNFDLSRVKITNATIGTIIPIDCIETLPGDKITQLKYLVNLIARNPNVKKQLTGMRCYVHAYYNRWSDLWEGAENFVDKGTSGNINLEMPTLKTQIYVTGGEPRKTIELTTPLSLSNYLDVPATVWNKTRERINQGYGTIIDDPNTERLAQTYGGKTICALPYVQYQKLYIEKYANRNLVQQNKNWIPDNQHHFILPYEAESVIALAYDKTKAEQIQTPEWDSNTLVSKGTDKYYNPNGTHCIPESTDPTKSVFLHALHFRQKKGDYFNTALPFSNLIRGETPTVELGRINWDNVIGGSQNGSFGDNIQAIMLDANKKELQTTGKATIGASLDNANATTYGTYINETSQNEPWDTRAGGANIVQLWAGRQLNDKLKETLEKATLDAKIDAFTIANLEIMSAIKIRQGLTNGRYNEMVKALFGYSPHQVTRDAVYIGGGYFDIGQTEILQTSESGTTPQGTIVSRLEGNGLCDCGTFYCPDYGYVMVVLSIVPDNYYKQGLEKWITKKNQVEVYNPLTNEMAPQAILNKELFWTGNPDIDEDLFGWTERNSEYKQRRNIVSGLCAVDDLDDSRYLSSETFTETPTLSNSFVTLSPQNVDMGIFSTSDEPPFTMCIGEIVKMTRPLPYTSVPKALKEN